MTYVLAIGDRAYSSWSLRGWLAFARFGIPVTVRIGRLYSPDIRAMLAQEFGGARTVPALRIEGEGPPAVLWDTLAIAETLAERHPETALWPAPLPARAMARTLAAEMHSSFTALRSACPMNLRRSYRGFAPSEARAGRSRPDRGALGAGAGSARPGGTLALRRLLAGRRLLRAGRGTGRHLRPADGEGGDGLRRRPPRRPRLPRLAERRGSPIPSCRSTTTSTCPSGPGPAPPERSAPSPGAAPRSSRGRRP